MLSVGATLKNTREEKGLSLIDIEKDLRIREKYLKAIEADNWNFFTSKIYIEGLIKNYSRLLGLDQKKMLAFFRREYEIKEEIKFKRKVTSHYLTPETKKMATTGLVLIIVFFICYFSYQLLIFLSPPKISIISPKKEVFKREEKIEILGQTEKEASITIFGDRIYQNKDGVFKYSFPLKKGKNELTIEVVGANGKKTTLKKRYVREF